MPLSQLDGFQILQASFDEPTQSLRVLSAGGGGPITVIISHTTDSIRLGNGTDFLTSTYIGAKVGLDVNVINSSIVLNNIINNISIPLVNTEQSFAFNASTKRFLIRSRDKAKLNIAFTVGTTGTSYISIPPGNSFSEDAMANNGTLTLYFRSTKTGTLEVLEWT